MLGVRYEALRLVNIKITIFWDVMPYTFMTGIRLSEELIASIFSVLTVVS
jgi:hypothetical protein